MITSEVEKGVIIKKETFPMMVRHIATASIWMLHRNDRGTVIVSGSSNYKVGEDIINLANMQNEQIWKILDDVTINFKS